MNLGTAATLHWRVAGSQIIVLLSVIAIDLTLAVDNAVVLGTVAARLPIKIRKRVLLIGVVAAAVLRIVFASFASRLLTVLGLTLVGGLLLLWVAWKLWRELRAPETPKELRELAAHTSTRQAVIQILVADLSMSLDNILAVAGAARDHYWIMVVGLFLSVVFMAIAANLLAGIMQKHRWISYVGLAIVVYVAVSMIWDGAHKLAA